MSVSHLLEHAMAETLLCDEDRSARWDRGSPLSPAAPESTQNC